MPEIESWASDLPGTYKWKALGTVAMGTIMAAMDMSIVNLAFPTLTRVFNTDLATVLWVTLAYVLVNVSIMLIIGRVSDFLGRRRIYVLGISIFSLGILASALAQSIGQLIFFRCLQAVGGAMIISCGAAIVTEAFPEKEMGKGLGFLGVAVSIGFICGPMVGGLLLDWMDWRAVFYMRFPVGFITVLMAVFLLEKDQGSPGKIRVDLVGAFASSAGLLCLVFGLNQIRKLGAGSAWVWLSIGTGFFFLVIFTLFESRTDDPIVDLSLFKNRDFSSATGSLFLTFVAAPAFILIMPFYLIEGLGLSPSTAGLFFAVNSTVTMLIGPASGWLSDRFGSRWFSGLGSGLMAVSFFLMRGFDLEVGFTEIVLVLALLGVGIGMFQAPNNSSIMAAVPRNHLGTASALIATIRQVGLSLGMALAGTLFSASRVVHQMALRDGGVDAIQAVGLSIPLAFHEVLLISAFLNLLAAFLSLTTGRKGLS